MSAISGEYKMELRDHFEELRKVAEEKDPDELAVNIGNILNEAAAKHQPRKSEYRTRP